MAWGTPVIHATGDTVTASDWNAGSNDLSFLAGVAGARVITSQTSSSTSYTDLATVGPAVTLTTGANAVVIIGAEMFPASASGIAMSFAVSGATTLAASDTNWVLANPANTSSNRYSRTQLLTGLTAGSNTFTAKYRMGTAVVGTWANRDLVVIPLP